MSNTSVLHQWTNHMPLRGRTSLLERDELLQQGCFIKLETMEKIRKVGYDQYRWYEFDGGVPYYEGRSTTFTSDLLYLMQLEDWIWFEYDWMPSPADDLDSLVNRHKIKEYTYYASVPFLLNCRRQDALLIHPLVAYDLCMDVLERFYAHYTWDIQVIGLLVLIHFTLIHDDERDLAAPTESIPDWSIV